MPRISVSNSFTETEIKSWGDPPSWAQGRSSGPLTQDALARIVAYVVSRASAASDDVSLWDAVIDMMIEMVAPYDGDNKVIFVGFGHAQFSGGESGANTPHAVFTFQELLNRSWAVGVMWR